MPFSSASAPLPKLSEPRERGVFRAPDGTPIAYETHGEGKALVLLYGLVCRKEHWHYQVEHLKQRYRVVLCDYRGHCGSGAPPESQITIAACADDVVALADRLELEEVALAGHSLGVAVTVEAALRLGERAKAAVLVCGSLANPFDHMFYSNRMNGVYRAMARMHSFFPGAFEQLWRTLSSPDSAFAQYLTLQLGFHPEVADLRDVRSYLEGVMETDPAVFFALLRDYTTNDRRALLDTVSFPTLIVAGSEDYVTPLYLQEEMARRVPGGRLEVIPGGSHCAHTDFPDDVNRLIERFLEEVSY